MPAISVIIPTFNRDAFLKKAITSVLQQSFQDFELIIVDDGSTDETKKILKGLTRRVRSIFQDNKGPAAARNRGIKEAGGEFIAFLDSDDWWGPDKLLIQHAAMRKNSEFLISHTQEKWFKKTKVLNQQKKHAKSSGDIFGCCLELCAVGMSTVMVRRCLFDSVGLFDESLACCEDYDLWLRVSIAHEFLLVNEVLTFKDGGRPDQVSQQFARGMDKFRIYSMVKVLESGTLNNQQRSLLLEHLEKNVSSTEKGA